jgi:hypothetical protein
MLSCKQEKKPTITTEGGAREVQQLPLAETLHKTKDGLGWGCTAMQPVSLNSQQLKAAA